ncbi:MAG: hypothetical protein DMD91_15350 [Candidatus Rokuibacteriota bacterium]|nr:MAG: hypothetical protein DMD91_15350 [Candidatus Rokubacteria bacterium]
MSRPAPRSVRAAVRRALGRSPAVALVAIVAPASIVAVLGYVSLRQWERSAELLFREQARDTASMAAEKVAMMLRHAEDDVAARLQSVLRELPSGESFPARAVDALVAASPLIDRLYLFDRAGHRLYPDTWRDADELLFDAVPARVPEALWDRGGRRDLVTGDHVVVVCVLRTGDGRPVLGAFTRNLDVLRRDIFAQSLGGLESPTIAVVVDHRDRTIYSRRPLDGAQRVADVRLGDELPDWRVALYQEPGASPRDVVRRQVMMFTAAFGVLLAVIVAGSIATWRLVRRESEMAQLKADFVANVSHDLKTPLSVIRMFGETLEMGRVRDDAQRQEYYRVITRESERLTRLIDNVLDFSRIEGGRRSYAMTPTAVEPLVRETVEAFSYPLAQQGFKVEVDVAPDLPDVPMDADAVTQALANLIDNAMKYSAERRSIRVETLLPAGQLAITVADEGIGIPRAEQEKIFEKFYRAGRSETQGRRGSGVGLALVRHVAEAHGGRVTVESEPGHGSRFTLWLPV